MKEHQEILFSKQSGSAQPHIYEQDIGELVIAIPPINEQKAFANFVRAQMEKLTQLEKNKRNLANEREEFIEMNFS